MVKLLGPTWVRKKTQAKQIVIHTYICLPLSFLANHTTPLSPHPKLKEGSERRKNQANHLFFKRWGFQNSSWILRFVAHNTQPRENPEYSTILLIRLNKECFPKGLLSSIISLQALTHSCTSNSKARLWSRYLHYCCLLHGFTEKFQQYTITQFIYTPSKSNTHIQTSQTCSPIIVLPTLFWYHWNFCKW